jgi:DNA (cytosine-5)-methyltransferase 1
VSDAICPALGPRGVRCQRWNQPAAHSDGRHQAGRVTWAYVARVDVDLFAGPGGMDEGRRIARRDDVPLLAIEWEPWACRTAAAAGHPRVRADVSTFPTEHLRGRVRLLLGAPPCPTFSMAGKGGGRLALALFVQGVADTIAGRRVVARVRRDAARLIRADLLRRSPKLTRAERSAIARARAVESTLVLEPARWIHDTEPEAVVLEQVPAVLPIWQALARELRARGWSAWAGILNAADYCVPQTRKRAILIASRVRTVGPPEPTHAEHPAEDLFGAERLPWVSMAEALGWTGDRSPRWMYPDHDGTHGRVVQRSNYSEGTSDGRTAAERGRTTRELYEPSTTITSKGAQWELRIGTHERATRRPIDQPAGTLFFGHQCNDVSWVVRTGNNSMVTGRTGSRAGDGDVQPYERSVDEPAPTLDTNVGAKWTVTRPAATVQGDPRIAPPGHRDREGGERAFPGGTVRITVEEAATLQGFPSGYPWQGNRTRQFEQVGNAVPPPLAARCLTAAFGPALDLTDAATGAAPARQEATA